ncbi:hypothetical protein D3C87_1837820 [compost metagenome]
MLLVRMSAVNAMVARCAAWSAMNQVRDPFLSNDILIRSIAPCATPNAMAGNGFSHWCRAIYDTMITSKVWRYRYLDLYFFSFLSVTQWVGCQ